MTLTFDPENVFSTIYGLFHIIITMAKAQKVHETTLYKCFQDSKDMQVRKETLTEVCDIPLHILQSVFSTNGVADVKDKVSAKQDSKCS